MKRRFRYDPATDSVVEVGAPSPRSSNDWKPLVSENMGFDGKLEDAHATDRNLGAPAVDYKEVEPGCFNPVFHDRVTYNKYLKAYGMANHTSGKGNHGIDGKMIERAIERVKQA